MDSYRLDKIPDAILKFGIGKVELDFDLFESIRVKANQYLSSLFPKDHLSGLTYSLLNFETDINIELSRSFSDLLTPWVEEYLPLYEVKVANLIIKYSTDQPLALHQDWVYTDINQLTCFTGWIPLVNTTQENGAFHYLPGSHKNFSNFISGSAPSERLSVNQFDEILTLSTLEGEGLFFDQRLVHGSWPNTLLNHRPVLSFLLKKKQFPLFYYHQQGDEFRQFEINEDILFKDIKKLSSGLPPFSVPVKKTFNHSNSLVN